MESLLPSLGLRKSHCSGWEVEQFQVSKFLHTENECLQLLFTNNSHVSYRPEEGALSIPRWWCGNSLPSTILTIDQ